MLPCCPWPWWPVIQWPASCWMQAVNSHQSGAIFQENIGKSSKMIYKCWSFYGFSMDFLDLLVSLQQGLINVTLLTTHKNEIERLVGAQAMAAWIRSWQGARKWSESPEFQTQPEEVILVLSYLWCESVYIYIHAIYYIYTLYIYIYKDHVKRMKKVSHFNSPWICWVTHHDGLTGLGWECLVTCDLFHVT